MPLGELLTRVARRRQAFPPVLGLLAHLAAPSRRCAEVVEAQLARRVRIVLERDGRLRHLERIFQQAKLALVTDAMMLEGLEHLELEAARIVRIVVADLGALEHEADAV